ncbi:MAG TPA: DUF4241 domain-containing protein [Polyangia bacterium]|nr:DUF4241 domain-containing protein [Polyangia bacterium]
MRNGKWLRLVALALIALYAGDRYRRRHRARPSETPIVIAYGPEGACAPLVADAGTSVCPYGPATGTVGGIDYGAPFEATAGPCQLVGRLRVTSGHIAAVDPLVFLDAAFPLEPGVAPGDYPVILRLHQGDVALALLMIGQQRPVRWAQAIAVDRRADAGGRSEAYAYGVDAGTGCYADAATAALLRRRKQTELERRFAVLESRGMPPGDPGWNRAFEALPTGPDLLEIMGREGYGHWVNVCVDPATGANLVAFQSGAGDGVYKVFAGTDAAGKVAAFVTDFGIIDSGSGRHPWIEGLDPR